MPTPNIIQRNLPVAMRRDTWEGLPEYSLPPEYSLRLYRPGDESNWLKIHEAADAYNQFTPQTFAAQFGDDERVLAERQYYLKAPNGQLIGTATAWWNDDWNGNSWGRIHWVAIVPEFQGRGLAKPLLTQTCARLRTLGHDQAFLTTSTARLPAIRLYRNFGFTPHYGDDTEAEIWRELNDYLE